VHVRDTTHDDAAASGQRIAAFLIPTGFVLVIFSSSPARLTALFGSVPSLFGSNAPSNRRVRVLSASSPTPQGAQPVPHGRPVGHP
jgi:hypothetical protein